MPSEPLPSLSLLCCRVHYPALAAAVASEGWHEVSLACFPGHCREQSRSWPMLPGMAAGGAGAGGLVLAGSCADGFDGPCPPSLTLCRLGDACGRSSAAEGVGRTLGVDHGRALLGRLVAEWRLEEVRQRTHERELTRLREIADHVAATEFLRRLAGQGDEAMVGQIIEEMFCALFAAGLVRYLACDAQGRPREPLAAADRPCLLPGEAEWAWTEGERGFILRLGPAGQALGLVLVDALALPQFRHRYLRRALDLAGPCALALGNARNIRHLEQVAHDLTRARDAAEAANLAKDRFLANISHELRTPLNAIIGFGELLLLSESDPARSEQLSAIRQAGYGLLELIQDILDYTQGQGARPGPEAGGFNLAELIGLVAGLFRGEAEAKGLALVVDAEAVRQPALVHGPAEPLRRVLKRLIDNAIRFTTTGSVRISAEPHQFSACGTRIIFLFNVVDSGPGIPPEHRQRIFELFEQGEPSAAAAARGSGMGLAVARRLVASLGGNLWLESTPGAGSRFSFTAAFEVMAAPPLPGGPPPAGSQAPSPA